jgi:dipeptidyl aminopeptidase/acylaminoacyl peptidase
VRLLAVVVAALAAAAAAPAEPATPFYTAVTVGTSHSVVSSDGDRRVIPNGLFGDIDLSPDEPSFVSSGGQRSIYVGSLAYGGRTVKTPLRTAEPVYGPGDVIAYGAGATLRVVGGRTYRLPGTVVEVAVTEDAFAATVETPGTLRSRLYLIADGKTKLLAAGFGAHSDLPDPQFSPDGTLIAFERGGDVWVTDRFGRTRRISHTASAKETGARWSPDGLRLAYATGRHGVSEVYVATLDGREHRLTHSKPPLGSTMGAWSPDGESIAVVTNSSVGVVPATGGTERIVKTFRPVASAQVGPVWWSPSY